MSSTLLAALDVLPLIAILRGIAPQDAEPIGSALYEAGFRVIEVPLNSPQPEQSIAILRRLLPPEVSIGAGTVLDPASVASIADAGGDLIVMPHSDAAVIRAAKARGLSCVPGVATPSEAFAALAAGADALKAFPAEMITPPVLKAWRAVLPKDTRVVPVGGINPQSMAPYVAAGANGFGLGSALYKPGASASQVAASATTFVAVWRELQSA
jgi:2-dehydro-3-deoxyphosphogalactonate aldolase